MPEGKGCLLKLVFSIFTRGVEVINYRPGRVWKTEEDARLLNRKYPSVTSWFTAISFSPDFMQCCLLPKFTIYKKISFNSKQDTLGLKISTCCCSGKLHYTFWIFNNITKTMNSELNKERDWFALVKTNHSNYMYVVSIALPHWHPWNKT